MNTTRLRLLLTSAGTLLCSALLFAPSASAASPLQSYVEAMQPGTNLGNTLDAIPNETSWGNPPTTQAMIQAFAAQGYKSIRLPVTWTDHTGPGPNYTIDPAWLARVQQVVDWSLDAGLYVVLNVHHDSWQWVNTMPQNHDAVLARYRAVWTQIAAQFANRSNKLMFESINEPVFSGVDDATAQTYLDELQTAFCQIVRSSGGSNATRPLVLTVLGGSGTQTNLNALAAEIARLNDSNLIATEHFYGFWPFSVNIMGYTEFNSTSVDGIVSAFDAAHDTFTAHGIPVIVGEFGVLAGNNIERGEYLKYHEYVAQYTRAKGLTHMFWDAGQLFDRTTFQSKDPDLSAMMMQTETGRATTADSDLVLVRSGSSDDAVINLNLNGNRFVSLADGSTTLRRGVDYTLDDTTLRIKANELAQYASGAFGEKTVLTVNVDSGPAWKLHVRYVDQPVLSTASGTTGGALVIPTAFNGDLLATMEARYADGTPAGPANWTPFKGWGVFLPDYVNNTITLTQDFFAGMAAGTVNLTFHFWSGRTANDQLSIHPGASAGGNDLVIYDENLAPGWQNWSWASTNTAATACAHSAPNAISVDAGPWGAVFLGNVGGPLTATTYHTLTFWANGGPVGGQRITISASANWNSNGLPSYTIDALPANTWTKYEVPLAALGVDANPNLTSLMFMNTSGTTEPTFYLDDIHVSPAYASWLLFVTGTPTAVAPSTDSFGIKTLGLHRDPQTNRLVETVEVRNTGAQPVAGPITLVLDRLSLNTSLLNAVGVTTKVVSCGNPYVTVSPSGLAPNAKATAVLEFSLPTSSGAPGQVSDDASESNGVGPDATDITFTPVVLSGGATP